ncbi:MULTISPECIES: polyprenyl synthetase family protein [unclassified Arthrobacter]|uniref:polyprenyl synthetase family protein n=1 Tax=unclassified Arthrobacter TaxID=235627 RepID=UPI001D144CCA|nr:MULTISPECIES: polyprenyl synthetase family protein [unclassified Arthrobacter]MCC3274308.1 polyprenyl synthetase family protein [Arthrobacter sp. zg-Y20]MCC9178099.1 polyprenyl synthetase family protein [Arthrobacter sp. zg-Y750]MDK1314464.1 polyprenyl synthetase family protein [Arthrobacter sp. zg.Y20]WIB07806.1 polyprenyl synthetase family protein [Arthrobacter sp. zg-Y20]
MLGAELEDFLAVQHSVLAEVSAEALPLLDAVRNLARGGKRLRALLAYWGWRGAGGAALAPDAVRAGVALELFQSAALIHDDIIDRSDTRRGGPSVHRTFSIAHADSNWHLDGSHFGASAGILAGDLCLSLSEEMFTAVGQRAAHGTTARRIFNRMRTEVMAGQYLDILEEVVGPSHEPEHAVVRARNILRYKAAKYTTEHPLTLGGALAGAEPDLLSGYSRFALPLGEAFQLRDDVLGVFGDPQTTGKPAGDDLREGKRTVLIAYALAGGEHARREITARLGDPELDDDGVAVLRGIIQETGALAATEELISRHTETAFSALGDLSLDEVSRAALDALAHAAVRRSA